jgi:hypothetical protein
MIRYALDESIVGLSHPAGPINESRALWQTHPLSLFHCKDKGYPLLLVEIKGKVDRQ